MAESEERELNEAVERVEAAAPSGLLDKVQEKLISRKLLVFCTATGLLAGAGLDSETWGLIAVVYVGGQAAIDAVKAWKWGGQ